MDQRIRTLVWVVMAGGLLLASEQVCPQRWAAVGQQPATNTVHGPGTVPQPMLIPPEEGMRPSGAPDVPAAQAPRPAESLPGDARPAASAGMKVPVPPAPGGATLSADAPKSSPDAPAIPDVRPVQEASPPLFYLKDKSGNLVPVPGFRLEDFESMVKRQHRSGTADQAPRYTIQSVAATGTAKNSYAELSIQLKILIQEEGWVRVPLRLDQAVLRGGQEYRGPGQQFLHYEPAAEGYVLWVRSGPGQEHQLTLDALVPLVRLGEETRLRLIVPRAATSELRLSVPMVGVVAEASEGATLLPPVATAESSTLLTAVGIGGDLELAWRKEGTPPAESPSVLEAVGQLQVKADGRGFEADVQLSVRSLGGPFDSFRVRLPKGAELVPAKTSQYTLNAVKAAGPTEQARLVEVRLAKKTTSARSRCVLPRACLSTSPARRFGSTWLPARCWGRSARPGTWPCARTASGGCSWARFATRVRWMISRARCEVTIWRRVSSTSASPARCRSASCAARPASASSRSTCCSWTQTR